LPTAAANADAPGPASEGPADLRAASIDLGSSSLSDNLANTAGSGSEDNSDVSSASGDAAKDSTMASTDDTVSEPDLAPEPAPDLAPELAAIVEIPAQEGGTEEASGEGGEWDLLVGQIRDWMATVQLQQSLQEARRPLILLGLLLALVVVLRLYAAVLGTLDHLPLVPGLLELVGVIAVVRFGLTNLVRSQQRQALVQTIVDRWKAFKG
jgi:hypothetical protein